jgi:enolase
VTHRVAAVALRSILDSRARPTVEADVALAGGARGTGSSPVAIAPGRLEARRTDAHALGRWPAARSRPVEAALAGGGFAGQPELDARLVELEAGERVGAGVTLALSLAFARAAAEAEGRDLVTYLAALAGTEPRPPTPLVNVFSGGVHDESGALPFQEVMVVPPATTWAEMAAETVRFAGRVERSLAAAGRRWVVASAGGLVVERTSWDELQGLLAAALEPDWRIGVDVAAEHLRTADGRYRCGGEELDAAELGSRLEALVASQPVAYLEDPFDPDDLPAWRALTARLGERCHVVADDLFATQTNLIAPGLANAMVVKLSQNGTVWGTVRAACRARELGLALCVSHRSGETEDCGMCDLAVALGAEYVKLGAPRRERLLKYNRLIRLEERLTAA